MVATYEDVVAQSRRRLTSIATHVLGDVNRGEDVAQDALAALYRDWDRVENPGGFVQAAVRNRCRDVQRREIHAREKLPLLRPSEATVDDIPYLADVLATLSPLRRKIVVLRFYGDHTIGEIADLTGLPEGTIKSNLHRALEDLRAELVQPDAA